jgi:hypothetical protein
MEFSEKEQEFLSHLTVRMGKACHVVTLNSCINLKEQICSFKLWNLSGQFVGFQQYNYVGDKKANNKEDGKYWTILNKKIGLFGLEYLNYKLPYLFITEGVFDAISLLSYGNAIAVLSNKPDQMSEQIKLLPFKKIAVCDGDKAGESLAKFSDTAIMCPVGEDANSLMQKGMLEALIKDYKVDRNLFDERLK